MSDNEKPWLKSYPPNIRYHLDYPDKTLGQLLDETVAKMPDTLAMIFEDQTVTYRQFGDQVNRLVAALADMGIEKGERVGLMGPNCPQWEIAFFALLKLGAIVVQTNPMYVEREIAYQMNDSGATTIIVFELLYPRVKNILHETSVQRVIAFNYLAPVKPTPDVYSFDSLIKYEPIPSDVPINPAEDLAVLQYTGGTTGVSKGAMLTHRNLICNTRQNMELVINLEYGKERVLTLLPVFHVYGMTQCVILPWPLRLRRLFCPASKQTKC